MLFRLSSAVALSVALLSGQAAAITCAVCPPSIVYAGLTRTLTLTTYSSSAGTAQCNYDTPSIPGFSPYCIYKNVGGAVFFTNTGATLTSLPGACPSTATLITKSTSTC